MFAARNMVATLNKLGHQAAIFDKPIPGDESMYIIYQANHVAAMPKNYILQQTEIAGSHWFRPESGYLAKIKKAAAVWDYSMDNIQAYGRLNKNVMLMPPGIFLQQETEQRDIPFLFYGWIEGSERRARIVRTLKEALPNLVIVTDKLGEDMWSILRRTKVVLNVHYHENSPLESYRIGEAYSFGCAVLTEHRGRHDEHEQNTYLFGGLKFAHAHKPELSTADLIDGLRLAGIETINEIEA